MIEVHSAGNAQAAASEIAGLATRFDTSLEITSVAFDSVSVSGTERGIQLLQALAAETGRGFLRLPDNPLHTSALDFGNVLEELRQLEDFPTTLGGVLDQSDVVSSTGRVITMARPLPTAQHLWSILREPIRFDALVAQLAARADVIVAFGKTPTAAQLSGGVPFINAFALPAQAVLEKLSEVARNDTSGASQQATNSTCTN